MAARPNFHMDSLLVAISRSRALKQKYPFLYSLRQRPTVGALITRHEDGELTETELVNAIFCELIYQLDAHQTIVPEDPEL